MPGGDGTGPLGHGPMTGSGLGFCVDFSHPGYSNPGISRGFGRCGGRGLRRASWKRGLGVWGQDLHQDQYYSPYQTKEEEKTYLENIVKRLEEEINSIHERINKLSRDKKEHP